MTMSDEPMLRLAKKVCLLGDYAVGKTSLVRRFVYNLFDDKYISTIGVKVSRKTLLTRRNDQIVELALMLWDLAGSEEFDRVRVSYLRGAEGAILVCDLTRPETLTSLRRYADEMRMINPEARLVLAANKRDLVESHGTAGQGFLDPQQVEAMAVELGAPYYLTSAKVGNEVDAMFRQLGQALVDRNR